VLYSLKNVSKTYGTGTAEVRALNDVTIDIPEGKFVVILGPSGSGKSTLLNLLGGMDSPSSGTISFRGEDITQYSARQLTKFRRKQVGFVFQAYNLLPDLTARENVEFSTEIAKLPQGLASDALVAVGLSERAKHYPSEMSGGEQQRVSIARAIAGKPDVLLCDEPTGALDYKTGNTILEVLHTIHDDEGHSVLVITHNREIAKDADMVISMQSGKIIDVTEKATQE
jgi:putative ABC transport system ATP-binding protein